MSIAALEPLATPTAGRRLADRRREARSPPRSLVVDHGCDVRAGHARLEPPTVLALLAWLPLTDADLAPVEADHDRLDPIGALALILRPPTIWSPLEALAVRECPRDLQCGSALVTSLHRRRLLRAAGRIEAQLPLPGLSRASELVAEGCAIVVHDPAACADAAAAQLVRYATSNLIRRL